MSTASCGSTSCGSSVRSIHRICREEEGDRPLQQWDLSEQQEQHLFWLELESTLAGTDRITWVAGRQQTQASVGGISYHIRPDGRVVLQSGSTVVWSAQTKLPPSSTTQKDTATVQSLGWDYRFRVPGIAGDFICQYRSADTFTEDEEDDSVHSSQNLLSSPARVVRTPAKRSPPFAGLSQLSVEDQSEQHNRKDTVDDDDRDAMDDDAASSSSSSPNEELPAAAAANWNFMSQEPELHAMVQNETQPSFLAPIVEEGTAPYPSDEETQRPKDESAPFSRRRDEKAHPFDETTQPVAVDAMAVEKRPDDEMQQAPNSQEERSSPTTEANADRRSASRDGEAHGDDTAPATSQPTVASTSAPSREDKEEKQSHGTIPQEESQTTVLRCSAPRLGEGYDSCDDNVAGIGPKSPNEIHGMGSHDDEVSPDQDQQQTILQRADSAMSLSDNSSTTADDEYPSLAGRRQQAASSQNTTTQQTATDTAMTKTDVDTAASQDDDETKANPTQTTSVPKDNEEETTATATQLSSPSKFAGISSQPAPEKAPTQSSIGNTGSDAEFMDMSQDDAATQTQISRPLAASSQPAQPSTQPSSRNSDDDASQVEDTTAATETQPSGRFTAAVSQPAASQQQSPTQSSSEAEERAATQTQLSGPPDSHAVSSQVATSKEETRTQSSNEQHDQDGDESANDESSQDDDETIAATPTRRSAPAVPFSSQIAHDSPTGETPMHHKSHSQSGVSADATQDTRTQTADDLSADETEQHSQDCGDDPLLSDDNESQDGTHCEPGSTQPSSDPPVSTESSDSKFDAPSVACQTGTSPPRRHTTDRESSDEEEPATPPLYRRQDVFPVNGSSASLRKSDPFESQDTDTQRSERRSQEETQLDPESQTNDNPYEAKERSHARAQVSELHSTNETDVKTRIMEPSVDASFGESCNRPTEQKDRRLPNEAHPASIEAQLNSDRFSREASWIATQPSDDCTPDATRALATDTHQSMDTTFGEPSDPATPIPSLPSQSSQSVGPPQSAVSPEDAAASHPSEACHGEAASSKTIEGSSGAPCDRPPSIDCCDTRLSSELDERDSTEQSTIRLETRESVSSTPRAKEMAQAEDSEDVAVAAVATLLPNVQTTEALEQSTNQLSTDIHDSQDLCSPSTRNLTGYPEVAEESTDPMLGTSSQAQASAVALRSETTSRSETQEAKTSGALDQSDQNAHRKLESPAALYGAEKNDDGCDEKPLKLQSVSHSGNVALMPNVQGSQHSSAIPQGNSEAINRNTGSTHPGEAIACVTDSTAKVNMVDEESRYDFIHGQRDVNGVLPDDEQPESVARTTSPAEVDGNTRECTSQCTLPSSTKRTARNSTSQQTQLKRLGRSVTSLLPNDSPALTEPREECTQSTNGSKRKRDQAATPAARRSTRKRRAAEITVTGTEPHLLTERTPRKAKTRKSDKRSKHQEVVDRPSDFRGTVRVLTTGIKLTKQQKAMITDLGGVLIEDLNDAHTVTHILATDGKKQIKRTPKLMIALCRTTNIVSLQWLLESSVAKSFLPSDTFRVTRDKAAEAEYEFSLTETLNVLTERLDQGQFLLTGWSVYVCSGVAGKKAPSKDELHMIVEAAGGRWLEKIPTTTDLESTKISLLLVTSDPEQKKQLSSKSIQQALRKGAQKRTTKWLFRATFTQTTDLPQLEDA